MAIDEQIHRFGDRLIVDTDGQQVVRIVRNAGSDRPLLQAEVFDETHGRRAAAVTVDQGDFQHIVGDIGNDAAVFDFRRCPQLTGDDLAVDGFDDAN